MKIALDLHDFSVVHNRLLWLYKLKEIFPTFKVSLFTVAKDQKTNWGPWTVRGEFLAEIKKNLDWLQLIPHGLTHESSYEAEAYGYGRFKHKYIPEIEKAFQDDGLPYERGFCAPHWRWNSHAVKALDDLEWWGAIDRDKKMHRPQKFYQYNYLLNDPFWEADEEIVKVHGHVYGTRNDLAICFENLLKLPRDVEWHFVTDFLEENEAV